MSDAWRAEVMVLPSIAATTAPARIPARAAGLSSATASTSAPRVVSSGARAAAAPVTCANSSPE